MVSPLNLSPLAVPSRPKDTLLSNIAASGQQTLNSENLAKGLSNTAPQLENANSKALESSRATNSAQETTPTKPGASADIDFNQDNALDMVYQAAIDGINKAISPFLGEEALQKGYESGLDVSPEVTADRIVSLSTGFYSAFQEQNPNMEEELAREAFTDIISKGIDNGFSEARSILEDLAVLDGTIAENINQTYDLVFEGLTAFAQGSLSPETASEIAPMVPRSGKPNEDSVTTGVELGQYNEIAQSIQPRSPIVGVKA